MGANIPIDGAQDDAGKAWREAIFTRSPRMQQLLAEARMVAQSDASVLIQGESGTGEELLARAIHAASARGGENFVGFNCGAIPENLVESELFGHVKGAFTGAVPWPRPQQPPERAGRHNRQMRIQLLSDLHLEVHPHYQPLPAPEAQLLVLAGDIGSYQAGSLLAGDDFGLERFSPKRGWPVPVLYVPGNHEYDNLDFEATHVRLRETCKRLGITWLEREVLVMDEVRFIGTTLWADFDALITDSDRIAGETRVLGKREKAFRAANYYLQKTGTTRGGEPMLAPAWREQAMECEQWLRGALARPFDGTTVVVTHFAPSLRSADPRYGLTPGTAGFCNSLDELLPLAQLWLHGHLHCQQDYLAGGCRIVANTLGYAARGEQKGFREQLVIEIPPRAA